MSISLRQRILRNVESLSLETTLFDQPLAMPVVLSPVGLTGMFARRGEVQAAKAAAQAAKAADQAAKAAEKAADTAAAANKKKEGE